MQTVLFLWLRNRARFSNKNVMRVVPRSINRRTSDRRAVLPMGDMFAVGGCDCTCAPTGVTVTCKGCSSILFTTGQSIQTWNHSGGTLLATYTTNSSGQVSIPAGTYWIIPANGRFVGQNVTLTTAVTLTFAAATGYVCSTTGGCPLWFPYPTTLYWSDNDLTLQPITMTAGGGSYIYNEHASVAKCDSAANCNANVNGHPWLELTIDCYSISRGWGETSLCGSPNCYDINGPAGVCRLCLNPAATSSLTGFTGSTNPPFAFSGVLSVPSGGALPDPVGGTVTISE